MIPKGQENKIYTIVKGRETFYRRHTVPVTSCSEVKYVLKRVSFGSKGNLKTTRGYSKLLYKQWWWLNICLCIAIFKVVLLLWILFVIRFYVCHTVLSVPCSLVVTWPLDSLVQVCDVFLCFCHFPLRCPGSGVVFDCVDFWSLPSAILRLLFSIV